MHKKVLIADDSVSFTEALQFYLAGKGIECFVVYNGLEALKRARKDKPDLILVNHLLPRIDGYKVSRLLKFDEKYKYIPLIMLGTRSLEKYRQLAYETGADEFLVKSESLDEFWEIIRKYLR